MDKDAFVRLRRASELRRAVLELKYGLLRAYEKGDSPVKPEIDLRSDVRYWERIAAQHEKKENRVP